MNHYIDRTKLINLFELLGQHLQKETRLCLIGSALCILDGAPSGKSTQEERITEDLDCWFPLSEFDHSDLRQAVEKSDLLFDPKDFLQPDKPYIQIIHPGISELPNSSLNIIRFKTGNLTVCTPQPECIIASKLLRSDLSDIHDSLFLIHKYDITISSIETAINTIPGKLKRETALENLTILKVYLPTT